MVSGSDQLVDVAFGVATAALMVFAAPQVTRSSWR